MPQSTLHDAVRWLRDRRSDMERLLALLVQENSFTAHREGGNRVGALLREALDVPTLTCSVHRSERFADGLVFATAASGRPAILVGHLDTVFPPGTFEGFRQHEGRAFGPGVLDMKGGLVVAVFTLLALQQIDALRRLPMRFVVVGDEELGSPESQALLRGTAREASFGLVFEGGRDGDAIVTRRRGIATAVATAIGRAAHAGNAHAAGVNAIWALARFIDLAQSRTEDHSGRAVNVGMVSGGSSKNTVPDRARCDIDLRFTTRGDGEALLDLLRSDAARAASTVPGAAIEFEGRVSRDPLERTAASARLLEDYLDCARASGLGAQEAGLVGGGSDANTLAALGVPCIDGLGPRGSGYHTHDEQIELDTLVPKAEAAARLLFRASEAPVTY